MSKELGDKLHSLGPPAGMPRTMPCKSCPGILSLSGDDLGEDAFDNLLSYISNVVSPADLERARSLVDSLRDFSSAGDATDIRFSSLLGMIPAAEVPLVQALIADVAVFLTIRRNGVLRRVRDAPLHIDEARRLLDEYVLGPRSDLDKDLPKVVCQLVVARCSGAELREWATAAIADIGRDVAGGGGANSQQRLGRLVTVLRWVSAEWAEDSLLDLVWSIGVPSRIELLRIGISVLRALFARPTLSPRNARRLLDFVITRFDGQVPVEWRSLMQSVLTKGGRKIWKHVRLLMKEQPGTYLSKYFIELLARIDKRATGRFMHLKADALVLELGQAEYLRLVGLCGCHFDDADERLAWFWSLAQRDERFAIVDTVEELRCTSAGGFLIAELREEEHWPLKFRIVDAVASVSSFEEMMGLMAFAENDPTILRYHVTNLVYRRIVENPMLLLGLEGLDPLHQIERARRDLYKLYLLLNELRSVVDAVLHLCRLIFIAGLSDGMTIGPGYEIRIHREAWEAKGLSEVEQADLERACAQADRAVRDYHANSDGIAQLCTLLEHMSDFDQRSTENVFERSVSTRDLGPVLSRGDIDLCDGLGERERAGELQGIKERADHSIIFVREALLYQEWFIRECPFVLHESMADMVCRIEACEELPPSVSGSLSAIDDGQLRPVFGILHECTKQGVYLTDVILDYLKGFDEAEVPKIISTDLTHHRSVTSSGDVPFRPEVEFERHLQFTTYAHDYRYGREALDRPSIVSLWFKYLDANKRLQKAIMADGDWPDLRPHPDLPPVIGPLTGRMYEQHAAEARRVLAVILDVCARFKDQPLIHVRVIPNLNYGLYCLAPIMREMIQKEIHVSFAGLSSQYCDDTNVSRWYTSDGSLFPVKRHLFSKAGMYRTLNNDRVLIVVDGTMEPLDRHDARKIRMPKAYRGYLNFLAAVNFLRAGRIYGEDDPVPEVAESLGVSRRYVSNLVSTRQFRELVQSMSGCLDEPEFQRTHREAKGRSYYSFVQWNPDGMPAWCGATGYRRAVLQSVCVDELVAPTLVFISMSSLFNEMGVPAYFDNNPEIERPRVFLGPEGVKIDIGWPAARKGVVI